MQGAGNYVLWDGGRPWQQIKPGIDGERGGWSQRKIKERRPACDRLYQLLSRRGQSSETCQSGVFLLHQVLLPVRRAQTAAGAAKPPSGGRFHQRVYANRTISSSRKHLQRLITSQTQTVIYYVNGIVPTSTGSRSWRH